MKSPAAKSTFSARTSPALPPEERAREGIFLAFQYPLEIPGVSTMNFLKTAMNSQAKIRGEKELDAAAFLTRVSAAAKELNISEDMLKRPLNVGFSGGEKKRNETLQMALLKPKLPSSTKWIPASTSTR